MRYGRRKLTKTCNAKNRRGTPCQCKLLYRGSKCKYHGGKSLTLEDKARITAATGRTFQKTGPKTPEGKARSYKARIEGFNRYQASRRVQP